MPDARNQIRTVVDRDQLDPGGEAQALCIERSPDLLGEVGEAGVASGYDDASHGGLNPSEVREPARHVIGDMDVSDVSDPNWLAGGARRRHRQGLELLHARMGLRRNEGRADRRDDIGKGDFSGV
jgi:hypothetical protein